MNTPATSQEIKQGDFVIYAGNRYEAAGEALAECARFNTPAE